MTEMGKAGCKVHKMDIFAMRGIRQDDSCSKRHVAQKDGERGCLLAAVIRQVMASRLRGVWR